MFGWQKRRIKLLQEFEEHIELETRENIEAGMTPEDARLAARRKFGNVLLAAEESRTIWGGLWLERLLLDIRYAVRSLRGAPAYTATLLCTLVLGLGAVAAMMAIVECILLRPIQLPNADQLVTISAQRGPNGNSASSSALSYKAIDALRRNAHAFSGLSGYNTTVRPVTAPDGARINVVTEVTPDFFPMLGVRPKLGRLIGMADANTEVAVVSYEFWRERLNSNSRALGSALKVSGKLRTLIGILPPGIHVPQGTAGAVVYVPIALNGSGQDEFLMESAVVLARLRPDVKKDQALSEAQSIFKHADETGATDQGQLVMRSYRDVVTGDLRRPLLALLGAVGVLLLIACANAANLQIGRAASRMPEMNVRSALGASFARLLQQVLVEAVLVALAGAALGGVLAWAVVTVVRHAYGAEFPRFDELALDPLVLGATAALAVVVGVISSIAPALRIHRHAQMRSAARTTTQRSRLPGFLVGIQVALTCVLLIISGLFVRTLQSLEQVKLGFDPNGVTTLVLMPEDLHQSAKASRDLETTLLHRLEALPGIQSVTMQSDIPFSNFNVSLNGTTEISGRPYREGDAAFYSLVSTNFIATSGIRLIKGRGFLLEDETSPKINVLVNDAFVRRYLEGREALGTTLRFHRKPNETVADLPFVEPMTIVGVVENELQGGDLSAPYEPMVYLDYLQLPADSVLNEVVNMSAQYALRSTLQPAAVDSEIRETLKREAPGMVEMSLEPMEKSISKSLGQRHLALRLVGGFGIIALILSAVGIYGVLAYSVALRRREIGIRMALGSSRAQASGLVLQHAGWMVLMGLVPGLLAAWAAAVAIRSFLFGVGTFDALAAIAAGTILLAVSALATCIPAWRAAQVDPAEMLRAE